MKNLSRIAATALLLAACAYAFEGPTGAPPGNAAIAAETTPEVSDSKLELFADLPGPMLRGLTISSKGRIFVTFPRMAGNNSITLAELIDGRPVPYPSTELNQADQSKPVEHIFSVMSAVVYNRDRLWVADTGRIGQKQVPGAAKLIGIDLATNKIIKTILMPPALVTERTVLHDLRYDASKGKDGAIYISDSSPGGKSGILVVDLATGKILRRLTGHKSVMPEQEFLPIIEGRPMVRTLSDGNKVDFRVGVAGLAVKPDGQLLYYCPQSSRELYSVDANLLFDPNATDAQVQKSIEDIGAMPAACDGMEIDKDGNLYFTDYENSMIWIRRPKGQSQKLIHDSRLVWPDSLWIGHDGYLYISCSHFHQLAAFNEGKDQRSKSYQIFRYKINASPGY